MTARPDALDDSLANRKRMLAENNLARLRARIARRFKLTDDVYTVGPLRIPFTRVTDPDRVLDQIVAEEDAREKRTGLRHANDEMHLPYWAELWDSAFGVAEFLVASHLEQSHDAIRNGGARKLNVLDLGCGMGLSGVVAATLGHRVMLADLEKDCLLFARLNTFRFGKRCRTRRVNWQADNLQERFDLILGADVLYDKSQWQFLERFWLQHLAPAGEVLLGEPGRQTGGMFLDWLAPRPWNLTRESLNVATGKTIRLFRLAARTPN